MQNRLLVTGAGDKIVHSDARRRSWAKVIWEMSACNTYARDTDQLNRNESSQLLYERIQ